MSDGQQPVQNVYVEAQPTNGLGTAGFIVSLAGLLCTAGVLSPIGLLLSFVALFKRPRGMAIAGFVLGLIGTAIMATFGFAFVWVLLFGNDVVKATNMLHGTLRTIEAEQRDVGAPLSDARLDALTAEPDPFGNAIRWERSGDGIILRSAGPDGTFGTYDDLSTLGVR